MAKENFGQAMNELFGVGKANGKTEEKPEKAAAKTENVVKKLSHLLPRLRKRIIRPQLFQKALILKAL
ncbi:MAG: hypothetical protein SPC84_01000 [Oscillospiraceae bacterium]|nr:hypothetical protein [Oscillospiraceae bacterium]